MCDQVGDIQEASASRAVTEEEEERCRSSSAIAASVANPLPIADRDACNTARNGQNNRVRIKINYNL